MVLLQVEPANRPSAKQLLSIPPVNKILKDFLAKMRHMEGQDRKESVESPAILRKRDQSFRYDVRFDLTMQDAMCEEQSNEAARSQMEAGDARIVVPTFCIDPSEHFAAVQRTESIDNQKHEPLSTIIDSVRKHTDSNIENIVPSFGEQDQRKRTFVIKNCKDIGNVNTCNVNMRIENRPKNSVDWTGYAGRYEEASIKDSVECNRVEQCDDITTCTNREQTVLGKRKNGVATNSINGTKVRILGNRNEEIQGSHDVENVGSRIVDTVSLKPASHIYESVSESELKENSRNYDSLDEHGTKAGSKRQGAMEERRKSRSISHLSPRFRTRVLSRIRNVSLESIETCKKVEELQVRMSHLNSSNGFFIHVLCILQLSLVTIFVIISS